MADFDDKSTVVFTFPESVAGRSTADDRMASVTGVGSLSVNGPVPGKTYIIKDASSGDVITLACGEVVLCPLGQRSNASTAWKCVASQGWLAFQNPVSGRFLGCTLNGTNIVCTADHVEQNQRWVPVLRSHGSFTLKLMGRINISGFFSPGLYGLGTERTSSQEMRAHIVAKDDKALAFEFRLVE